MNISNLETRIGEDRTKNKEQRTNQFIDPFSLSIPVLGQAVVFTPHLVKYNLSTLSGLTINRTTLHRGGKVRYVFHLVSFLFEPP